MILWILITLFLIITGTVIIIPSSEEEHRELRQLYDPKYEEDYSLPDIYAFGASTDTINGSGTVTLTGYFTGGTGVISASSGEDAHEVYSNVGETFEISKTTTFTLTVTNSAGQTDTESVTVNVISLDDLTQDFLPYIDSFGARTNSMTTPEIVTLTGDFTGGTGVITAPDQFATPITTGIGTPFTISQTTTFTLTVTNNDGLTDTESVTVDITPYIDSFRASTNSMTTPGGIVTLTGIFTGGTAVITAPGQSATTITSGIGTPFTISQTTTFTLTVTNNDGLTDTESVTVTVPVAPSISWRGISNTGLACSLLGICNSVASIGFTLWADLNYSNTFRLTFPAGTTRVRLTTNPTVTWITNLPDFVPTANQTSADVNINMPSSVAVQGQHITVNLQLVLNQDTTPSYTFIIQRQRR